IGILKNKSMFNDCDTPLNFLIKYATQQENSKEHNNFYIDCIKVLLQNEEDPNIPDADGKTAIANAVEKEHSKFICLILDNSQYSV
ncbi:ankyrin repeat domain-containing protein, partial [Klebsiella pneumoniae]|nr:ankyrin repeat domain-containing protein [Klebsiella pneumoniae]